MSRRWFLPQALITAALILLTALAVGPTAVTAQESDASPPAGEMTEATPAAPEAASHPAHIHTGTCDTLGDVVHPLNNVESPDMMGGPASGPDATPGPGEMVATPDEDMADAEEESMGEMEAAGDDVTGDSVAASTTTIEAAMSDLLDSEHAINVHLSPEQIDVYIACGDIVAGEGDGPIEIELTELNDSGYTGQATLNDNGDGTITVSISLAHAGGDDMGETHDMDTMGTPEA